MIQSVGFQGTQPVSEKKESKKSHAAAGVVLGGLAGAGTAYLTNLGKKPEFEDVDTFISSDKMAAELEKENVKAKTEDVAKIKAEKAKLAEAKKASEDKIKKFFPDDKATDVELSKVLDELEGKPKLEDIQKSLTDEAKTAATTKQGTVTKFEEAVAKFEKGKEASAIIGEQAETKEVVKIFQEQGENKPVMMQKGSMVKNGEKLEFKPGSEAASELKVHTDAISAEVKAYTKNVELAEALKITKDSKAVDKVSKESVGTVFKKVASEVSQEAKTAFDNIKELLPKHVSGKMVAIYAGVGAVVAGLIGAMMKKKED